MEKNKNLISQHTILSTKPYSRNSWRKSNLSIDMQKIGVEESNESDIYYQVKEYNLMKEFLSK